MKTIFTLLSFFIFNSSFLISSAQVLCVKCHNQNARVLTDTNNLIVNGGFESSTCPANNAFDSSFCPNSHLYTCDIANWTCTGGGLNTYSVIVDSVFTIIPQGRKAVYFGNFFCSVCSSNWSDTLCINIVGCELTGIPAGYPSNDANYGGTTGVSLSQTVNGLTTGAVYELEFWAGGEWNNTLHGNGLFAVDVGFGNILLRDPPTPPMSNGGGTGIRYVIVFTADSSAHTFKFTNWGHIGSNHTELILDDVRLFASNGEGDPCITGINDLPENILATVFPNPATNLLTITITPPPHSATGGETAADSPLGAGGKDEIILYDIASRKLMQQKFSGSATLNIENLAKGVYLYEVRDEMGVMKQGKVVKE